MTDIERKSGYEPSAEREGGSHDESGGRNGEDRVSAEQRAAKTERAVKTEAAGEGREAKERIADIFWARPRQFVERVVTEKLAPYFKRFLGKFSQLDDDAMATDALKRTRDEAAKAAGDDETGPAER